ncbi:hypothetical protein OHA61_02425 [Streptomyces sp. NBC_00885]|uniref:hypothetical protein n=1 Tax=Streptomyces sp. NBC_00885 TaxID=2975857 RepID=UPI00386839F8|nr:hypothetical protein OHA61_02425 [Streptomyces sp. NBC_00885]
MGWVVGVGMALGLLGIALGTASIRTGWTLPWVRRRVTRPRMHGLGVLLVSTTSVVQGLFYLHVVPSPTWEIRFLGANALMFSGLILVAAGQMMGPPRRTR